MKTSGWNKTPLWARWLIVVFGFPSVVAILQVSLERWVSRLTADLLVIIALIAASILLFWRHKSRPGSPPPGREEKREELRELGKLEGLIFAICALVFFVGTIIGFYGVIAPDPPSGSWWLRWLMRIAMGIIGLIALLLTFVCYEQSKYDFLRATLRPGERPPPDEVSISYKTALTVFVIIAAIVFAISWLNRG